MPLIGAGYFSFLIALGLLFPSFPNQHVAYGGLIGSILLAIILMYSNLPGLCVFCLIAHVCHVLIWLVWVFFPPVTEGMGTMLLSQKWCVLWVAPCSVVALFASVNLTFMMYNLKESDVGAGLRAGDFVPPFTMKTTEGRVITYKNGGYLALNFVCADCPYCKEQLQVLNTRVDQLEHRSCRLVNIAPVLSPELVQFSPGTEWVEDREGELYKLFKVSGYPTFILIGSDGKIIEVIFGALKPVVFHSLDTMPKHIQRTSAQSEQTNSQTDAYEEEEDIWFGPGFYYGIWFANEQDYWQWRRNHRDYPPNHRYYNHDHPIRYHSDDHRREDDRHRDGEEHRGRGGEWEGEQDHRGREGEREQGGHRGGGEHGGGGRR
jgi:thioredoxin-related protein